MLRGLHRPVPSLQSSNPHGLVARVDIVERRAHGCLSTGAETRVILSAEPGASNVTVLQVLPSLVTGGVERGTVEMTEAVAASGWTALVASAGGRLVPAITRAGGRH